MKGRVPDWHSLPVQLILSFVALVILAAAAAGLPAIILIRSQLQHQAHDQVGQGSLATQALYAAQQSELEGLATLTVQRPTLRELLVEWRQEELRTYVETLQQGSRLDLVQVCTPEGRKATSSGAELALDLCAPDADVDSGFQAVPTGQEERVWLLVAQPLADVDSEPLATVWVGIALDAGFIAALESQTGLEQTLLRGEAPLVSSLSRRAEAVAGQTDGGRPARLTVGGREYDASTFPLGEQGLNGEVALDVTDLAATQKNLAWTLAGSILAAVVAASLLGTYLARRISSPLARLAAKASIMGQESGSGEPDGMPDSPIVVETRLKEVALLGQALETARHDLKSSLRQVQQEKRWTDHLLESIVEGIVTLDRRGTITFFSHGAERITGWPRDQVLGRACDQVFKPLESSEPFSTLIPPPGQRRKISIELADGRQAILGVTGARLLPPERGEARVALVFRDISEEEAVHRLLGHFLANVAHEFRTPLSALAASVELLLDQAQDLSPAELEELLVALHLGVLGLQTLIDNLLESASIETGHFRVHPRPCNIADVIGEAIDTMQPLLFKHGQTLVVQLPAAIPVVQADPRRTVQVLHNLLSNASKYGPDDTEIEICATVDRRWVRVRVADQGPGIAPEHRAELFRPFVHSPGGDSNVKSQVGVGLGLSVVKAIVEAHGGQVGIEDRPPRGSIFWFTLPREEVG